jgi:hypothetical protein
MTQIRITTKDARFAAEHGTGLDAVMDTVIEVAEIERVTFAGREMIRFDMASVAGGRLPRDWANRWTMYPATRIVG